MNYSLREIFGFVITISLIIIASLFVTSLPVQAKSDTPVSNSSADDIQNLRPDLVARVFESSSAMIAPQIEIAPLSGVSGYLLGIFGSDFGSAQGTVTILGQNATIIEWTSTFIHAEIPTVPDGTGNLTINTAAAQSVSQPFEVYTIDPIFQRPPRNRFINVLRGKTATIQNIESDFCYKQPEGFHVDPPDFITDFGCGFSGIIGDGEVVVTIPSGQSTAISVDLEQNLAGTYYFQFFSYPSWYADWDIAPGAYQIQVSANSTNGVNGSWQTVHTETDNDRGIRLHKIEIPDQGNHWIRMLITGGSIEPRAKFKEIRLYQSTNDEAADLDIMTVYGDSNTEGNAYHIGTTGFSLDISAKLNSTDELIFAPFALSGQTASGLIEQAGIDFDIYDGFAMDDLGTLARYWGIAVGNNDLGEGSNDLGVPGTDIEEFDERAEAIVQHLISEEKVPIIERIADTGPTGTDTLEAQKKVLDDIDRIAAQYRLIPGPDLYTLLRLNIERDNSSWFWPGDPYHHNWTGRLNIIDAWTDAFIQGTNRQALPAGMQVPGIVSQTSPVGTTSTDTPSFVWQADATAIGYQFVLYRVDTAQVLMNEYFDAANICGATDCAVQPLPSALSTNVSYVWLVKAINPAGHGLWSVYSP